MYSFIYKVLNKFRYLYFKLRYNEYRMKYSIHESFIFNGFDIEMYGEGEIFIGANSYIGNRSVLASGIGSKIVIGNNCSISHNVRIYSINRNPMDIITEKANKSFIIKNIIIGDNVWIGANVFVNQGIEIGSNVVIGANSVVTKDIPSNTIAVGSPTRLIRKK